MQKEQLFCGYRHLKKKKKHPQYLLLYQVLYSKKLSEENGKHFERTIVAKPN